MKIRSSIFCVLLALIFGCSTPKTSITSIENTSVNPDLPTVIIGQLNDEGKSLIGMTLAVFGSSEADIETASIMVYVNDDMLYSNIDPATYYHPSSRLVLLLASPLQNGDELKIDIIKNSVLAATYIGTVSDQEDTEAMLDTTGTGDMDAPVTSNIISISAPLTTLPDLFVMSHPDHSNDLIIDASVFGDSALGLDGAGVDIFCAPYDLQTEISLESAADYYDTTNDAFVYHLSATESMHYCDDGADSSFSVIKITKNNGDVLIAYFYNIITGSISSELTELLVMAYDTFFAYSGSSNDNSFYLHGQLSDAVVGDDCAGFAENVSSLSLVNPFSQSGDVWDPVELATVDEWLGDAESPYLEFTLSEDSTYFYSEGVFKFGPREFYIPFDGTDNIAEGYHYVGNATGTEGYYFAYEGTLTPDADFAFTIHKKIFSGGYSCTLDYSVMADSFGP